MNKKTKYIIVTLLSIAAILIILYFLFNKPSKEYTITFDSDGGTSVPAQIVKEGASVVKPADPTKENSVFVEWRLDDAAYNFNSAVSRDLTLKASWTGGTKYSVKVTLDGQDYTVELADGELLTLEKLNIPAKEGYKVVFTNNNTDFDINNPITSDMELSASYVELKTFTVSFNSNGGSKVSDVKVKEGLTITEPTTTRQGYVLDGWYNGDEKFDFSKPITSDLNLKANWSTGTKINVIFTVDGSTYKTVSVSENTKVSKPTTPTKKGYKFVEWQLDGKAFDFNTKITAEITLTAVFEESKTVTVTFDSDGGSSVKSQEIETGSKASVPSTPTKNGYKFVEWQLNNKKYDFNTAVNNDIKLKATWVKVYTVTFDTNGGSNIASQQVESGAKVTKPIDPTKSGHKFDKWLLDNSEYNFDKAVTKDIKLVAHYTVVSSVTPTPTAASTVTPTPTPTTAPTATPTPTVAPTATPTPTPAVTYSLEWQKASGTTVEQYYVFIKSSNGSYVAGRARLYSSQGDTYKDVNVSTTGAGPYLAGAYNQTRSYVLSAN